MEKIEFPMFMDMLRREIDSTSTSVGFTRTILYEALPDKKVDLIGSAVKDKNDTIIAYGNDNTLKGYYNGKNKIDKLAVKIADVVDEKKLKKFLNSQIKESDNSTLAKDLCSRFAPFLPEDTTPKNIADKLAALFVLILKRAKRDKQNGKKTAHSTIKVISDDDFEVLTQRDQFYAFYNGCIDTLRNLYYSQILDKDVPLSIIEDAKVLVKGWKSKTNDMDNYEMRAIAVEMIEDLRTYLSAFSEVPDQKLELFRDTRERVGSEKLLVMLSEEDASICDNLEGNLYYYRSSICSLGETIVKMGIRFHCLPEDTEFNDQHFYLY